jgi:energy-coupling factor transporter ATP-binding protein EcfA2
MSRYALVIGIAEYTGSFKSLETPVNNANAIADLLVQHGNFKQVKRLPSRVEQGQKDLGKVIKKSLTSENLTRELQQFLQDANGSEVLIYFSGHGFTRFDKLSGEKEGFLATSNCEVELDAEKRVITAKNGISLYSLNTLIKKHKFNSLVVILDCCNAGAFIESDMVRRDVTAFAYEWDHYFITACRGSRKAYEGEDYSLLTQAVLKGLARENAPKSGRISGDGLFSVVGEELYNSRQEPLRMGWGSGITLVEYHDLPSNNQEAAQPAFDPANPYVGLKAFESNQADYFHGRERAVRALLDRLNDNRFLAVIGPSGCGKSSLVKAGLLPELKADRIPGSHNWVVASFTPGRDPLTVLSDAFSHPPATDQTIVLFIDQFEELFTLCDNEEVQRQFIKRLHEETRKPNQQTRVILTMRGDFLDRCAKFEEAADLINTQVPTTYVVTPLTELELSEAIDQPALMHGATFEDGLKDKILEDVRNQQGALPLLQYALFELWKRCIENSPTPYTPHPIPHLTLSGYTEIGGVKGALQRRADQLYQEGFTEQERSLFWELMRELVEVSEEKATRRRANRNQLSPSLLQIARKLADQRLLMIDDATIEVAHEALLSEWSLLRDWIEENRDNIHLCRRLELDCQEWLEKSQSDAYLLTGGRLSAIEEWVEKNQPNLPDLQVGFLKKSLERRNKELQTQLDQERQLREEAEARAVAEIEKKLEAEARAEAEAERVQESIARVKAEKQKTQIAFRLGSFLAILSFLTGMSAIWAQAERQTAQTNETKALVANAQAIARTHDQLRALMATVEALKQLKKKQQQVPSELQKIVNETQEYNRLEGHTREVNDVAFSPNGENIVSGSTDGTIKLWNKEGKLLVSINNPGSRVISVTFSSDNQKIASGSLGETIRLWSITGDLKK